MNLHFNELLARAFLDLPDEVDLGPVVQSTGDPTRYSTIVLYDFIDSIASRYIGTPDEIMLSNLHDAIYGVLHGVAAYATRIRMSDLRTEAIRIRFEKILQDGIEIPEIGYSPEDIEIVKKYFSLNQGRKIKGVRLE